MLAPILVLLVLFVLNGVLAMSELAMMTSRTSRLQQSASRGSQGAATALALARQPTRFLSTVQVAITFIGILAGALGENQLSAPLEQWISNLFPVLASKANIISLTLVVVAIGYFSLVLGELVPKRVALAYPETVATLIARPVHWLSFIAAIPVRVLSASTDAILALLRVHERTHDDVSEDDVRALLARAASTGVFTPQEHALFQRVFRLDDVTVRDLMVPRTDIMWIDRDATSDYMQVLIGTSPHSHFPVCDGSLDKLIGVVHIKDLISYGLLAGKEFNVATVAQQPVFVPETLSGLRLLEQFQERRTHVAFVVDEHGGTQGLITLNDVLRALVGDVSRAGQTAPPSAVRRQDGSWLMDGMMPLHEMVTTLGLPAAAESELPTDVSTVAGLVLSLMGRIPGRGERTQWQGYQFEVVDLDGPRIDQVLVSQLPSRPEV